MLLVLPKGTEIRAFVLFIHKISCIQALIYCKFMMVLSNTLESVCKVFVSLAAVGAPYAQYNTFSHH